MNERVMQFRIGMFVIVAGLVLTMLIVWFGESPSLFRDHGFVRVRYTEAPGLSEGISVRKSGIRIGEVISVDFDDRPGLPEGVMVVLSVERKYKLKQGSIAKINRSLIGDVSIDILPGDSAEVLKIGDSAATAPEITGDIATDPSKALAAATAAFERAGNTLTAIETAANGFASVAKKAEGLDEFLATIGETGRNITVAAKGINKVIAENEGDLRPAVANIRTASEKINGAFDEETAANIRSAADRLASVSAKLDAGLNELKPVFTDLGTTAGKGSPTTNLGQALYWINRITANFSLLTDNLSDGKGRLNPNGSLQKLVINPELFDNLSRMAASASSVFSAAQPAIASLRVFADKLARDPSIISRGVLNH